jgi:hypothetical protein
MNTIHTEVLSAFVDGEPVEPSLLAAALDDPDARAALVDFVRFRDVARADSEVLPAALERLPLPTRQGRVLRWAAAAAVLLLMFVAGLLAPQPWRQAPDSSDTPPQPTRIERFEPGVDWHPGD